MSDMVNHPSHYTQASVSLEPIDILRYAPFDLGNCLKYILRAGHKGDALEDWKKAEKYIEWAIESCYIDCTNYASFFNRYGLLLKKFKVFSHFDPSDATIEAEMEYLQAWIKAKIKKAETTK